MAMTVNKRQLAEILGVSETTLGEWQRAGLPYRRAKVKGKRNAYDTKEVIDWLIARERPSTAAESSRDRLARLQADQIEIDLAARRGQTVPVSQIEPEWTELVIGARTSLLNVPARVAPLIASMDDPDSIRELLEEQIGDGLARLARDDDESRAASDGAAGESALGTAGTDQAVRVGAVES
jgi:phage terminase Nu1 subunit (DNA packaging protein)